jgi:signal transduction histidine kinase
MRSLTLKLTLAFLAVGLTGAVLVAAFVGRLTRRQFDAFVVDRYQAETLEAAANYYAVNGSWDGFEDTLQKRRGPGGQGYGGGGLNSGNPYVSNGEVKAPIALLDGGGNVIFDNIPDETGGNGRDGAVDGITLPVEVDGNVVGAIRFTGPPGIASGRGSPEARFLAGVDRAILWSALAAAGLALLLGAILANTISRPVQELTAATKVLAGGDLGHQVPVRTDDEIGELAKSFNQMSADLAHSNQLRRQMTADIAHDLRTPLSVILGYSEALNDGKLPGGPETYEAMHVQAQHLDRLIEDLRTLSLADAGQLSLMRRPIDPRGLLEHTALAYLPAAESRAIDLRVTGEDVQPVSVDPDRMLQVLGNLVGNALRHTPDGGRVSLSAARENGNVLLRVQDNGPGIPPEDLPHIFDRFYRGDKARAADGASGLGLAIARSLIEAHDGRIDAENAPGGGALFTIVLPLAHPSNPT